MKIVGCSYAHVFMREIPDWPGFSEDQYLICPLRDPVKIWRSWVKRWNTGQGAVDLSLFDLQWHHLEALDKEYELHYIPLDGAGIGHIDGPIDTDVIPDWDYIYNLPMVARFYRSSADTPLGYSSSTNLSSPTGSGLSGPL